MDNFPKSPACAFCKYQRRSCSSNCLLAPYFPPDQPHRFDCVRRLFGAKNVIKTIKNVPINKREDAVNSMIYEAVFRFNRDPVHGLKSEIRRLLNLMIKQNIEYSYVKTMLFTLKSQPQNYITPQSHDNPSPSVVPHNPIGNFVFRPEPQDMLRDFELSNQHWTAQQLQHQLINFEAQQYDVSLAALREEQDWLQAQVGISTRHRPSGNLVIPEGHHREHPTNQTQLEIFDARQYAADLVAEKERQDMFPAFELSKQHPNAQQLQDQQQIFEAQQYAEAVAALRQQQQIFYDQQYAAEKEQDNQSTQLFLPAQDTQVQQSQQPHHLTRQDTQHSLLVDTQLERKQSQQHQHLQNFDEEEDTSNSS